MNEQTGPLIRTMIYISGDALEHKVLTDIFKLPPTEIGSKGELKPNGRTYHNETYWKYSKDIYEYSISEAISILLCELLSNKERLNAYVNAYGLEVSVICNVTITEDRPVYQIEKDVVNTLSSIGAEFLMDIFDYSN